MVPAITGKQEFASDRSTTEYEFDFIPVTFPALALPCC